MNVDVLYIHPTKNLDTTLHSFMPVGIIGLLNILKDCGYSVYGINYGIEKSLEPNYTLEKDLEHISYKVLLLDLHWYEHSFSVIEIARLSKALYPRTPVVIGGITTTIFAKEILESFNVIDYAIKGDSEKPLNDLVDYLIRGKGTLDKIENICYRENGRIIEKDITYCCQNIDDIENIDDDFIKNNDQYLITNTVGVQPNRKKSIWITVGRGCLYDCTYCDCAAENTYALWGRHKMACRSPQAVVQDIVKAKHKGADIVRVTHDLEMVGETYYEKIFDLIKKSSTSIGFNYDAFQLPSISYIDKLRETFKEEAILIDITLLTANEHIRNAMGKNFSNAQLFELLDYIKDTRMIQRVYYSMNVENETMEDFHDTMAQIDHLAEHYGNSRFYINYQRVVLDPLASLKSADNTAMTRTLNTFMDYYTYCESGDETYTGYQDALSSQQNKKKQLYTALKQKYHQKGYYNIY